MKYSRAYVEITNICNMHCSFCHGHHRRKRQMTEAEFVHILQQLEGKTEYVYYHLMGEPLTHPDLPRFVELAGERGFHSVITTNGTLLDRRGQELISAGVHKVSVSLHSFEEGDTAAHVNYVLKVADFARRAAEAGVIICLRLWNNGCDDGKNIVAEECLCDVFPEPWQENSRGYRLMDKVFLEWGDRFRWPDSEDPEQGESVFCYGMRDHFGILVDGTVVPCCLDSEGAVNLGNVFETDLETILTSPRASAMAEGFGNRKATESLCRRCSYARKFG
ncbi:MAG: radical SAM protein [Oscillospiraceae bacterium]|nr:radical SAM protein [Oscillospiraceae bacterium]